MSFAELFEQLESDDRQTRDRAFDLVVEGADPELLAPLAARAEPDAPYWETLFCRYLQRVDDDIALPHLYKLLFSLNASTRINALEALALIPFEKRLELQLQLLVHLEQEVRLHSIEQLGQHRCSAAIQHLARLLVLADKTLVEAAFAALAQIDIPRASRQILPLLAGGEAWRRCAALEALGAMESFTSWKRLLPSLSAAEPEVRCSATLNLSRKAGQRANKYFIASLEREEDEETAKVLLNRMALNPNAAVVDLLIRTAAAHANPQIRRATGWIIEEIDEELLRRCMLKLLPKSDEAVQAYILVKMGQRQLAECGKAISVYVRQDESVRLRCAALEGLGFLGERAHLSDVVPYVRNADPMTSYVATLAAVQLTDQLGDCPALLEVLRCDDKETVVLKQVVLQYMIDALNWRHDDGDLLDVLRENIQSNNENIAYLSTILLGRYRGRRELAPLLLALINSEGGGSDIAQVARESLDQILDGDLHLLLGDLDQLCGEDVAKRLELLGQLRWNGSSAELGLEKMVALEKNIEDGELFEACARAVYQSAPEASRLHCAAATANSPWANALGRVWLDALGDLSRTEEQADWRRVFAVPHAELSVAAARRAASVDARWAVDALIARANREEGRLGDELRRAVRAIVGM